MTTGVRRQASGEGGTTISAEMGAERPSPKKRGYGEEQRTVMAALGTYSRVHSVPPLDRGLRSIVVQQVGNLLKGGYPLAEIKAQALSIFSQYNLTHGHKLMTQLQKTMEFEDERKRLEDHEARKQEVDAPWPVMKTIRPDLYGRIASKARHPNNHDFAPLEADPSSCSVCAGPIGVHVRRVKEVPS